MSAYVDPNRTHGLQPRRLPPPESESDHLVGKTLAWAGAGVLAVAALGAVTNRAQQSRRDARPDDDAPLRSRLGNRLGDYTIVGRTVTIAKPKDELYAFFRDFRNLPRFMENLRNVRPVSDGDETRHEWQIEGPAGRTLSIVTEITGDRKGEMIGWRSVETSDLKAHGHVAFRDAPAGRGSEVELVVAYDPPLGQIGRVAAKVLQREPHVQARRDLKRFKMLMETGEIATAQPYPGA